MPKMTKWAREVRVLQQRFMANGLVLSLDQVDMLRRAERVLHRWAEGECGASEHTYSWCIEREETTGKPFRVVYPHHGQPVRYAIPDREIGALRRVKAVCAPLGLHWYQQTDPRGCALYVSKVPLDATSYPGGVACCP